MSSYYERYGTSIVFDKVRYHLNPSEKEYYDGVNFDDLYGDFNFERGRQYASYPVVSYETLKKLNLAQLIGYMSTIPGLYFKDLANSEYVFQFFPLHPLWMAIFSSLFGETSGVYSLPFFALLTIIMFYRLAKVLSDGNEQAGLIAAGLLAINPLHSFFSKFPVTEVCFLFFTVSGFYYLVSYVKMSEKGCVGVRWRLVLSVALFLCSFLTRVTGFLYMPFFYLMLVSLYLAESLDSLRLIRKPLIWYSIAIICAYVVSVCYGLIYSFPYTMEQFAMSIGKPFIRNWQLGVPLLIALLVMIPVVLKIIIAKGDVSPIIKYYKCICVTVATSMFAVLVCAAALACARFVLKGTDGFMASTGVVAVSHMSPLAFLLLIFSFIALRREKDVSISKLWLALYVTFFWGVYVLVINRLPYQYYYARYLLSEVVPYSLLFVSLYLGGLMGVSGKKWLAYMSVAIIAIYSLYFTACQFKGREADGAYTALDKVARHVQKDDILFVTFNDFKLLTPLKFFFDLPAFRIEEAYIKVKAGNVLARSANSFILSKSPVNKQGVNLVDIIDYRQGQFEHSQHIPTQFTYVDQMKLYLYRIDKQIF